MQKLYFHWSSFKFSFFHLVFSVLNNQKTTEKKYRAQPHSTHHLPPPPVHTTTKSRFFVLFFFPPFLCVFISFQFFKDLSRVRLLFLFSFHQSLLRARVNNSKTNQHSSHFNFCLLFSVLCTPVCYLCFQFQFIFKS